MPSLKDLKNRIASVKATQKITKAMLRDLLRRLDASGPIAHFLEAGHPALTLSAYPVELRRRS